MLFGTDAVREYGAILWDHRTAHNDCPVKRVHRGRFLRFASYILDTDRCIRLCVYTLVIDKLGFDGELYE